jgi:hypothetical protein
VWYCLPVTIVRGDGYGWQQGGGRAHLSKALWMVWRWMGEVTEWEKLLRL